MSVARKPAPPIGWIVSLALLLATAACGPFGPQAPKAVVIGIDGADWHEIDALAAQGRLPHLTALRERGTSGPIETVSDIALSPVIWTSVATGKRADKHGITWFLVDKPDGTRAPVRSDNRRTKAIWNVLAESGLAPAVVGWWATYPAEDVGRGVIVSDALGFHGFGHTGRGAEPTRKTHPAELLPEVDALMPPEQQVSAEFAQRFIHLSAEEYRAERFDPARYTRRDPRNPIHLFQEYAVTAQGYTAIAESLLARGGFDLVMVYFEQVDSMSHLFMKYAPPKLPWVDAGEFERYRDAVSEWYVYQDELLGRLLAHIDLDETAVFVLSDHGFKTGERRIHSEKTVDVRKAHLDHEPEGILIAAGPGIRRGDTIEGASVLDLTPTLLHYLGLPVAKDMDGRVLEALFQPDFPGRAVRYVASYEDPDADRPASEPPAPGDADTDDLVAGLRALGYVEDDVEDQPPSSPEIHDNLGRAHLRAGDWKQARTEFEKALALDPNDAGALLALANLARARGRQREAERLVEQALRANPSSAGALADLADIRRDRGELGESIRLYRQALALEGDNPSLLLGLGDSLQRSGAYPEAEQAFRRALELEPDSFAAHYNLGVTYDRQGRSAEATEQYEAALAADPEHPQAAYALNNLANLDLQRGERERAIERLEEAARQSPDHFASRFNLGVQSLKLGRTEEGIGWLEQAVALEPDHEAANAMLGLAYLRLGRNRDAQRTLLLVQRLHPDNWQALLGLAALRAARGDRDGAKPLLAAALERGGDEARTEAAAYTALRELLSPDGGEQHGATTEPAR